MLCSTYLNLSLGHLEHGRGLLLAAVGQVVPVDRDDLVDLHEAPVRVGGASLDHLGDEDARPGLLADDGEAETLLLLLVELHLIKIKIIINYLIINYNKGFLSSTSIVS